MCANSWRGSLRPGCASMMPTSRSNSSTWASSTDPPARSARVRAIAPAHRRALLDDRDSSPQTVSCICTAAPRGLTVTPPSLAHVPREPNRDFREVPETQDREPIDSAVYDPLALVRIRQEQLVGGRPTGMLGRGVPFEIPGAGEPLPQPRPAGRSPGRQAQAELTLPSRQPLPRRGLERLQLPVNMRRAHVLDAPRATPGGPDDLDRDRSRGRLHVRTYATRRDYESRLVRKSAGLRPQTCRPQHYTRAEPDPVIKVGLHDPANDGRPREARLGSYQRSALLAPRRRRAGDDVAAPFMTPSLFARLPAACTRSARSSHQGRQVSPGPFRLLRLAGSCQAVCQPVREFPCRLQVIVLDIGRRYLHAEIALAVLARPEVAQQRQ